MESDVKRFFNRIIWSVSMVLSWLFLTLGLGLYKNLLIPEPTKSWGWPNLLFYILILGTLALILKKLIGFWKEKFPHG